MTKKIDVFATFFIAGHLVVAVLVIWGIVALMTPVFTPSPLNGVKCDNGFDTGLHKSAYIQFQTIYWGDIPPPFARPDSRRKIVAGESCHEYKEGE